MRINELSEKDIKVGMKIRSLRDPFIIGTIVKIDNDFGEMYSWIQWSNEDKAYGGFYWNHCRCEIFEV